MSNIHPSAPDETPAGPAGRLNSWKEIAAYLQRDMRTVQRWERTAGLPVHRHGPTGVGGVYAFKAELDAWWQRPEAADERPPETEPATTGRRSRAAWLGAGAALLVLAVGGWLAAGRGTPGFESGGMVATRVWQGPELTFTTSFSADARHVFYVDWITGDLAVVDPATRQRRRLTNNGSWFHPYDRHEWAGHPRASPDGAMVAFAWGKGALNEVRVARADGGAVRTVLRDASVVAVRTFEWSRAGNTLLVSLSKQDQSRSLALISSADGRVVFETRIDDLPNGATVSPDGRFVSYDRPSRPGATERDIWVVSVPDGRATALIQHPADDIVPLWSADGAEVLFLSDRTGVGALWSQPVDGGAARGAPHVVKHDMARAWPIGLDPDGTLTYGVIANEEDVFIVDVDPGTGRATGPAAPATGHSVGVTRGMTWSPDGSRLAYIRGGVADSHRLFGAGTEDTIWIQPLDGGVGRILKNALTTAQMPRWSPDGGSMLVRGSGPGLPAALYRIDIESGAVTAAGPKGVPRAYGWFGGNDRIFYKDWGGPAIVYDLASGQERTISDPADDDLRVSPDGAWVAYSTHDAVSGLVTLAVGPTGGGPAREVVRMTMPEWISALTWTPDGQRVVFAKGRRDTYAGELLAVGLDGGAPVPLGVQTQRVGDVQFSPDGRRLAFLQRTSNGEVWRLTNVAGRH